MRDCCASAIGLDVDVRGAVSVLTAWSQGLIYLWPWRPFAIRSCCRNLRLLQVWSQKRDAALVEGGRLPV